MMITERQIIELENLNKKQCEAVIAYGADLYRQGLMKGAIIGIVGFGIGISIQCVVNEIKSSRRK
ncbi:hypothetical protein [Blautia luti]|uniref:hypothetical protein n=1 Tax=Blautia luti TaxID=89014 RepID=UPI0018A94124|nr:hypothetical protein [Blautia luti]